MKIQWHIHHIIPKHMGGTDNPKNLLRVNVAMHAFLHKLLWEEHGHWQDKVAWMGLAGIIGHEEAVRESQRLGNLRKFVSEETRKKLAEYRKGKPTFLGRTHSEETKHKLSEMRQGKSLSEETRKKMSEGHKGKPLSESHRKACSIPKPNTTNYFGHENGAKTYSFIKDGNVVTFRNMKKYCAENGLSMYSMSDVFHGKRESYQGYSRISGE